MNISDVNNPYLVDKPLNYLQFNSSDKYDSIRCLSYYKNLYNYSTGEVGSKNISDGGYTHREHSLNHDTYQFCSNATVSFYTNKYDLPIYLKLKSSVDSFQFLDSSNRLYVTIKRDDGSYALFYYKIPKGILNSSEYIGKDISELCEYCSAGTVLGKFAQDYLCIGSYGLSVVNNNNNYDEYTITTYRETDDGVEYYYHYSPWKEIKSTLVLGELVYSMTDNNYLDVINLSEKKSYKVTILNGIDTSEKVWNGIAIDYTWLG